MGNRGIAGATLVAFLCGWALVAAQPCLAAMPAPVDPACPHETAVKVEPPCIDVMGGDCALDDGLTGDRKSDDRATTGIMSATLTPSVDAPSVLPTAHLQPEHTGPPLTVRYCCFRE